jgi:hypothetical protein
MLQYRTVCYSVFAARESGKLNTALTYSCAVQVDSSWMQPAGLLAFSQPESRHVITENVETCLRTRSHDPALSHGSCSCTLIITR